jgi:hypothetical protein
VSDIYHRNVGRELNQAEKGRIGIYWDKESLSNARYMGKDGHRVSSENDPLCKKFSCMHKEIKSIYLDGKKDTYTTDLLDYLRDDRKYEEVCMQSKYRCVTVPKILASYNCIGYALGISVWLSEKLFDYGGKSIPKYLELLREDVSESSVSNFDNIIYKTMHEIDRLPAVPKNNTVAFFFKDDKLIHASRYITSLGELEVQQWVSKLGCDILISHDLLGVQGAYSNNVSYFEFSDYNYIDL